MTAPTNILYVCSTSHLDWDWLAPFEQYYANGYDDAYWGAYNPVRYSFDKLFELLDRSQGVPYAFNLAEVGWLQRYLADAPARLAKLSTYAGRLTFLGGGITSPDNLVCEGEAFIRNFLLGRRWLRGHGLGEMISDVLWIPDDFGQDPNLPITVEALGFAGAAFWRVPGSRATRCPPTARGPCSRSSRRAA